MPLLLQKGLSDQERPAVNPVRLSTQTNSLHRTFGLHHSACSKQLRIHDVVEQGEGGRTDSCARRRCLQATYQKTPPFSHPRVFFCLKSDDWLPCARLLSTSLLCLRCSIIKMDHCSFRSSWHPEFSALDTDRSVDIDLLFPPTPASDPPLYLSLTLLITLSVLFVE